jgi:hypothetical protein
VIFNIQIIIVTKVENKVCVSQSNINLIWSSRIKHENLMNQFRMKVRQIAADVYVTTILHSFSCCCELLI